MTDQNIKLGTSGKSLVESLLAQAQRARVDAEFVTLIRDSIAARGGIKGMAYKTGFAMLEKAKPGILERGVQKLLPQFMQALEPLYAEAQRKGIDFAAYLQQHSQQAAQAIVTVADGRMAGASETARRYYDRFRGSAEDEVRKAVPLLAALIQRYI